MLELATRPFYTHDTLPGIILVAVVCGSMAVIALTIAYMNFGPPAKRRQREGL